jgi:hypothetical protein
MTYQGALTGAGGAPIDGPTTLRFQLFNSATGGTSLAGPVVVSDVPVSNGLLSTEVDFGTVFQSGSGGWIEIAVLDAAGNATVLSPRQKITPAPLASGIAGLTLVQGQVTDVDNTAGTADFAQFGGGGNTTAYLSFVAGTTGRLAGVTFRLRTLPSPFGTPTFYSTVYAGVGTGGSELGSTEQVVPAGDGGISEFTLDLSSLNITVTAGQAYSVSILCGMLFSISNSPVPGTSGSNSNGYPTNWWFRTSVPRPLGPAYATQAGSASIATTATTARTLDANAPSALNGLELRLANVSDGSHGLGIFRGAQAFRNTGYSPDGPVLFGFAGGGLGTATNTTGTVALRWNDAGQVSIGGPISSGGYRLELPNTAGPAGQGRANAWVTYSSRELKQNIATLADPLATINRLRGVSFDWKQPNADGTHTHDIGFIAEEVAAVLPELVTKTTEGKATGLDYGRIVPLAIEAIKQQQATIESLRSDAAKRESENVDLKARLAAIEAALAKLSGAK